MRSFEKLKQKIQTLPFPVFARDAERPGGISFAHSDGTRVKRAEPVGKRLQHSTKRPQSGAYGSAGFDRRFQADFVSSHNHGRETPRSQGTLYWDTISQNL